NENSGRAIVIFLFRFSLSGIEGRDVQPVELLGFLPNNPQAPPVDLSKFRIKPFLDRCKLIKADKYT
ncbi:MAG: hypothetical protein QMC60_05700, partial [Amylibacter sp.]